MNRTRPTSPVGGQPPGNAPARAGGRRALLALGLTLAAGAGANENATENAMAAAHDFCATWSQQASALDASFLSYFPGVDGWLYHTDDFKPLTPPDDGAIKALRRLVAVLAARGTRLVLVVPPPRGLVAGSHLSARDAHYASSALAQRRSYKVAVAALARSGALVPDIQTAVDAARLPLDNTFYRKQDAHWRAEGAELTAKAVASAIAETIDLSAFPPRRFVTRRIGEEPYRARLLDALDEICGIRFKREAEPRYVTEAVDTAAGTDLLGDAGQPVVLAGTSFSASEAAFNFSGFLSQALAQDVLNVAISGGGLETSILSYLGSADFRTAPPAALIWEVRPHELPDAQLVRQLLATLEGECAPQSALFTRQISLERGLTPLLALGAAERQRIAGPSYLDLAIGATAINKFTLRLAYSDFSHEDIEVDLTRAPVAASHYYFALPSDPLRALETIALRPATRTPGEVTASVCAAKLAVDGKG